MKLKFNACPKCRGDLELRRDIYGVYVNCLQCGLQRDLDAPHPAIDGAGRRRRPGTRRQGPHPRPPRGSPESRLTLPTTPQRRANPRSNPSQPRSNPSRANPRPGPPPELPRRRRYYPAHRHCRPGVPPGIPPPPDRLESYSSFHFIRHSIFYSSFRRQPESGHSPYLLYRHSSTPPVIPAPAGIRAFPHLPSSQHPNRHSGASRNLAPPLYPVLPRSAHPNPVPAH